ncbi:MAG: hypothetical protein IT518_20640 [Burkholderiales bacterium]|nr:hypothetical protein [Burkholderiales bacterium]
MTDRIGEHTTMQRIVTVLAAALACGVVLAQPPAPRPPQGKVPASTSAPSDAARSPVARARYPNRSEAMRVPLPPTRPDVPSPPCTPATPTRPC